MNLTDIIHYINYMRGTAILSASTQLRNIRNLRQANINELSEYKECRNKRSIHDEDS